MNNIRKVNRNYGIDLLRLLSMYLVVMLHVLGQGGVLNTLTPRSYNYNVAWLIELLSFCAVNCFGIISGYVGINSKYRVSNLIYITLQVIFYNVFIKIGVYFLFPNILENFNLFQSLFPFGKYWYFDSYFIMFLLIPLINWLIKKINQKYLSFLIYMLPFFMALIPTSGYNFVWLSLLYILGAILKLLNINKIKYLFLTYILINCISWGIIVILDDYISVSFDLIVGNTSIVVLLSSILLVVIFSNLNFVEWQIRLINKVSPHAFGIYLFHTNPILWSNFLHNSCIFVVEYSFYGFFSAIFFIAFFIFFVSICIDFLRGKIFTYIKISKLLQYVNYAQEKIYENTNII